MELLLNPVAWLVILLVTAFSVGLQLAGHALGEKGWHAVEERFPKFKPEQWERAQAFLRERGSWALLITAVPGLGVLLSAAAGALGVKRGVLAFWGAIGVLARNWLVVLAAGEITQLLR